MMRKLLPTGWSILTAAAVLLVSSGCLPEPGPVVSPVSLKLAGEPTATAPVDAPVVDIEPFPTRPPYEPGQQVDYTAQAGDTLPALAARFNTTIQEIRAANPIIPDSATTMPPGMPMKIPIYYRPLWGSPYQIIPDSLFVFGPAQIGFDAQAFVEAHPGWLKNYSTYIGGKSMRGGDVVNFVAAEYSVSPRLLLAITEYMSGGLSQPERPNSEDPYILGKKDYRKAGFYLQVAWLADALNGGYYNWRTGELLELQLRDGRIERPDPWQNAATVALQSYFASLLPPEQYYRAVSAEGLADTYTRLFGNPWENDQPHIPGSLVQPAFTLPFEPGRAWAYTGGPHSAWGEDAMPLAALDFAPPSVKGGCTSTDEWSTAVASGMIVRTGTGIAVLDLDEDGDERTGWVIFYLHLETVTIPPVGTRLAQGQRIGKPSCDGGRSTGTHIHIARKYNGEWILADGLLTFNMEGWLASKGRVPYQGTLKRNNQTVSACTCSDRASHISAQGPAIIQPAVVQP